MNREHFIKSMIGIPLIGKALFNTPLKKEEPIVEENINIPNVSDNSEDIYESMILPVNDQANGIRCEIKRRK